MRAVRCRILIRPKLALSQYGLKQATLTIGRTAIFDTICAMRVYVLVLDGVFDLGLSAILDAFQTANELIEMTGLAVPRFEVKVVGMRKTVRTAHGLRVPIQPVGKQKPDCVIVPAIACKTPETLKPALARPDVRDAAKAFRE